jgi:mono/diheme cytochrome c family protein
MTASEGTAVGIIIPRVRKGGRLPVMIRCASAGWLLAFAICGPLSEAGLAGQGKTVADGVYSDAQATRGQQVYQKQCAACHGNALEGAVGPTLAGDNFLAVWGGRSLADLVDKIEKTMPPQQQGSVSRPQAIDLAAFVLRSGKYPAGQTDLGANALGQVTFPARSAPAAASAAPSSFTPSGTLAQLMRAVTFPNANILFNVQVKDPAKEKPAMPIPFDYVLWGSTVYYGWQSVDQAALALVETTPLFLLPGRRCENGRPVPVDRADWKQYTAALVDVGKAAYKAAQTRDVDAVNKIADQLNEACANCHKVYRDGTREGSVAGATRCQ